MASLNHLLCFLNYFDINLSCPIYRGHMTCRHDATWTESDMSLRSFVCCDVGVSC